jgi:hypothetical protein
MAGSDSGKETKETDPAHAPIEEIASEFREIRKIKGHFDGEKWKDGVDKWKGRKHRLMIELSSRISGGKYKKDDIIKLLDQPDRIVHKGDDLFKQIIHQHEFDLLQKGYEPSTMPSYEFLVYYWRGKHDFLFFICLEDIIVHSDWWYAGE